MEPLPKDANRRGVPSAEGRGRSDLAPYGDAMKTLRWWWRSVQGLRTHLSIHAVIRRYLDELPPGDPGRGPLTEQLRQQEGMLGHCLLHVLLVYPLGSGAFWDEDE